MAPSKCSYINCNNLSSKKSMFRFPVNNKSRLNMWLENCGNRTLSHLSSKNLYSKFICMDHFKKEDLKNLSGTRKRLSPLAVPHSYQIIDSSISSSAAQVHNISPELKVLKPKKTYGNKCKERSPATEVESDDHILFTPQSRKRKSLCDADTPKCKKLRLNIINSNKLLKKEKLKSYRLKKKVETVGKNVVNLDTYNYKSETSKVLAVLQFKDKKRTWTEEEKKVCLSLYYKSSGTYKYLLKSGVVLAAPSTIQKWLSATNTFPGINDDIFENIRTKYRGQDLKERACAVCFDEMAIMSNLEYNKNKDLIEGFEDYGDGRSEVHAKHALVFVVRGIYSNWKLPIAYFLVGKSLPAEKLCDLIKLIISRLFDCHLLPKSITCDQGTTNVKAIKMLGVTIENPFFFVGGRKIFSFYDVPHLIKNVRNNLLNSDYDNDGSVISFKDIVDVYNIDKCNKSRTLKKITPVHINPNSFQKMKVKYATQVLSSSMSAAIETAADSGELKSLTARNTAKFVQSINDLFDSLNSKNKIDKNPFRCGLTKNKNTVVNKSLKEGLDLFSKLKKVSIDKKGQKKLTIPPCFDGMKQTINSMLQLSSEEFTSGIRFIMTYRFNQDVIENLFGIYRLKGGCNRNPTARTLRTMFRSQLLNSLIKLEDTNCEMDDDTFSTINVDVENVSSSSISQFVSSDEQATHSATQPNPDVLKQVENINVDETHVVDCGIETSINEEISLEKCSVVYFAGWVGKKCLEKFSCVSCKRILFNDSVNLSDKKQLLIINKTFSNITEPSLKSPTDYLYNLTNNILSIFEENIEALAHQTNLISKFIDIFEIRHGKLEFDCDTEHLKYIVHKLYETKIYNYCKMLKKSSTGSQKLKILQNK